MFVFRSLIWLQVLNTKLDFVETRKMVFLCIQQLFLLARPLFFLHFEYENSFRTIDRIEIWRGLRATPYHNNTRRKKTTKRNIPKQNKHIKRHHEA